MAETNDSPEAEGLEELPDEWAVGQAWYGAWLRYLETGSDEDEHQMLAACIPVLKAVAANSRRSKQAPFTCTALGELTVVLQDRLAGWGWLSLTKKTGRQGRNSRHLRAMGYAWAYIEAAQKGVIAVSDPFDKIQTEYSIDDRNSIYRWRRKYTLPPAEAYQDIFYSLVEDRTERARRFLRMFGRSYQRKPSDTSPAPGPRTGILPRVNGQ